MQVLVLPVHATVEPALLDVERLHQLPILAPLLALPNLLKGLRIDVADTESLIQKMRRASEDVAIPHCVDPEHRSRTAFVVVMRLAFLLHGTGAVDDLERLSVEVF